MVNAAVMLKVIFSNQLDSLVAAMREAIARERPGSPLFQRATIVSPSSHATAGIRRCWLSQVPTCAHLEFLSFRHFLSGLFQANNGGSVASAPHSVLLDDLDLTSYVVCALESISAESQSDMRLADASDAVSELERLREARAMSKTFELFMAQFPDWLNRWESQQLVGLGASEARDAQVWRWIRKHLGQAAFTLEEGLSTLPAEKAGTIHVAGFSSFSKREFFVLWRLSQLRPVCLYVQNPCAEFWEDVAGHKSEVLGHEILRMWGGTSLRSIAEITRLSEGAFDGRYTDHGDGRSLLSQVQNSVLRLRENERDADSAVSLRGSVPLRRAEDDSLCVEAFHSIEEELEAIVGRIHLLMQRDRTLTYSNFSLLIPQQAFEVYLPLVEAIFFRSGQIPFHTADLRLVGTSRYYDLFDRLLGLLTGGPSRRDFIATLCHPLVLEHFEVADRDAWLHLIGEGGAFFRQDDDIPYAKQDGRTPSFGSWEAVVSRLVFGQVYGPYFDSEVEERHGMAAIDPEDLRLHSSTLFDGEESSPVGLAMTIQSRLNFLSNAYARDWSVAEFSRFLENGIGELIPVREARDIKDRARIVSTLRSLAADASLSAVAGPSKNVWRAGAGTLATYLREKLTSHRARRGALYAHGVHVGLLEPDRYPQDAHIFIAGLGDDAFPRPQSHSERIRQAKAPGEITAARRDRWAFLQTLLSARRSLSLSYVDTTQATHDPIGPSLPFAQLCTLLSQHLGVKELARISGAAHTVDQAQAVSRIHWSASTSARCIDEPSIRNALTNEDRDKLFPSFDNKESMGDRAYPTRTLSRYAIKRFLEEPWAGRQLAAGLGRRPIRKSFDAVEPFDVERSYRDQLLQQVLRAVLCRFDGAALSDKLLRARYHDVVQRYQARGQWPLGTVAEALESFDLASLRAAVDWARLNYPECSYGEGEVTARTCGEFSIVGAAQVAFRKAEPGGGYAQTVQAADSVFFVFQPRAATTETGSETRSRITSTEQMRFSLRALLDAALDGYERAKVAIVSLDPQVTEYRVDLAVKTERVTGGAQSVSWLERICASLVHEDERLFMPGELVYQQAHRWSRALFVRASRGSHEDRASLRRTRRALLPQSTQSRALKRGLYLSFWSVFGRCQRKGRSA